MRIDQVEAPTRVVVIGSNSFSGASFVRYLLERKVDVLGISRSPEVALPFAPYRWTADNGRPDGFTFRQLDLNHHTDEIDAAIQEFEAPCVVNFAAQSMVGQSWSDPEHWYQTNVLANVRLFERLRHNRGLRRYVHISTPEVYGSCTHKLTENRDYNPSTPYATSRAACDMHLMNLHENYGFPVVFTRAANVYGPGQQLYRIIPRTVFFIRTGRKLQLHGGGHSIRSFIHIDDVAEGTFRAASTGKPPAIYHFSTDRFVSIRELIQMICRKMDVDFDTMVEVVAEREGKDAAYRLDSNFARRELGWQDRVTLEAGVDATIEWVDAHLPELERHPIDYQHKP